MRKILSIFLCLCVLLSVVPCVPVVASEEEVEDEIHTTDDQTLEKLGFDIDESAYNLNALKPGTHAGETQKELVVTGYLPTSYAPLIFNRFYEFEKTYSEDISYDFGGPVKKSREFEMKPAGDEL